MRGAYQRSSGDIGALSHARRFIVKKKKNIMAVRLKHA